MDAVSNRVKKEAACILYDAFKDKIAYVWIFTHNRDTAVHLIMEGMNAEQMCIQYIDGKVAGVAGYELSNDSHFIRLNYQLLRKSFGNAGGTLRFVAYQIYKYMQGHIKKDAIHLDLIAVSENFRGQGVGRQLLEDVEAIAKHHNKDKIVLEVVNSNPRAQQLYERAGFQTERFENVPFVFSWLTKKANFDGFYIMTKRV